MNFTITARLLRQSVAQAIDDGETKSAATPLDETIMSFGWAFLHQVAGFNPTRRTIRALGLPASSLVRMALSVLESNPSGSAINWQPAHWEYSIPRAAAFWSVENGAIICTGAEKTPSFSNAGTPSVGTV